MTTRIEMDVMKRLLRDDITFDDAQTILKNPDAFKFSEKGMKNKNHYWTGKIQTARMTVAYCWYLHRNAAGYFVGWRSVYLPNGRVKRDQFTARKTKKRLAALQMSRGERLKAK